MEAKRNKEDKKILKIYAKRNETKRNTSSDRIVETISQQNHLMHECDSIFNGRKKKQQKNENISTF